MEYLATMKGEGSSEEDMDGTYGEGRVVAVAQAVLNGDLHPIEGCREILSFRYSTTQPDHALFYFFVACDSETDHFPLGTAREHGTPKYIRKVDQAIAEYLAETENEIRLACQGLIALFDVNAKVVRVASAMAEDKMHLVEGCRQIARLKRWTTQPEHEAFNLIEITVSEMAEFTLDEEHASYQRKHFKSTMARWDKFLAETRGDLIETCKELIRALS